MLVPYAFLKTSGSAPAPATNFCTDLVAAWQFENSFEDFTENGHDATKTGTVTITSSGKVDDYADFQGSTDYLTVSDHNDFSFTDGGDLPFSICAWVKFDATSGGRVIINKRGTTTNMEYLFTATFSTGFLNILSIFSYY